MPGDEKSIRVILLAHASESPENLLPYFSSGDSWKWLFLGRDYSRLAEWERNLPTDIHRVAIGERLQDIAWELRGPFLDLIAQLGKKYNSLAWWMSRIAERNTMVSPLFLYTCYLCLADEILANENYNVLIVGESWALLETISERISSVGKEVKWIKQRSRWKAWVRFALDWMKSWYGFLRWGFKNLRDAEATRALGSVLPLRSDKPRILIHTWVDEACFGQDGTFKDRYFGPLPDWLRCQGYDVVTIPCLYNINWSWREAFIWFRQNKDNFLMPEDFYRKQDYIWAIGVVLQQMMMPCGKVIFRSMDITRLVSEAKQQQALDTGIGWFAMYYQMARQWVEVGLQADILLDTFENMIPEKGLGLGIKVSKFEAKYVGCQITLMYPHVLCLYTTPEEAAIAPHPDIIVCNGPFFRSVMAREGFPEAKLITGASLRYAYLANSAYEMKGHLVERNTVFVPLPLEFDAAMELLLKLGDALKETEVRVWLKPHPMTDKTALQNALQGYPMAKNVEWVGGAMAEWVPRAACAVTIAGGTALELFVAGVPTIRNGRETALTVDPLGWFPNIEPPVYTAEQLRLAINRALSMSESERQQQREYARAFLERVFTPVTDETLRVFVPEAKRGRTRRKTGCV